MYRITTYMWDCWPQNNNKSDWLMLKKYFYDDEKKFNKSLKLHKGKNFNIWKNERVVSEQFVDNEWKLIEDWIPNGTQNRQIVQTD